MKLIVIQSKMKIYKRGDSIMFYAGPFAELIAKIESVDKNNRIWVLMEAMGGYRRLKLQQDKKI